MTMHKNTATATAIRADEAQVNFTYMGQNTELPDPVSVGLNDDEIKRVVAEVAAQGHLSGMPRDGRVAERIKHYVIERCAPTPTRAHWLFMVRPKTAYGFTRRERPKSAFGRSRCVTPQEMVRRYQAVSQSRKCGG